MTSLFDDPLPCNRDEGERCKRAALALLECNREAAANAWLAAHPMPELEGGAK